MKLVLTGNVEELELLIKLPITQLRAYLSNLVVDTNALELAKNEPFVFSKIRIELS